MEWIDYERSKPGVFESLSEKSGRGIFTNFFRSRNDERTPTAKPNGR